MCAVYDVARHIPCGKQRAIVSLWDASGKGEYVLELCALHVQRPVATPALYISPGSTALSFVAGLLMRVSQGQCSSGSSRMRGTSGTSSAATPKGARKGVRGCSIDLRSEVPPVRKRE